MRLNCFLGIANFISGSFSNSLALISASICLIPILSTAIISPIQMFTNFQLRVVQATDVNNKYVFGHYLTLRFLTSTFTIIITTLIALTLNKGLQMLFLMLHGLIHK